MWHFHVSAYFLSMEKESCIIIRNVGPIKDVTLHLNRINVLIGPQGSGKSTIAKLISFCSWLEKEMTINQKVIETSEEYLKKHLFDYHRISPYFDEKSYVLYKDDCMEFEYSNKIGVARKGECFRGSRSHKTAYIPAERIMAAVPNVRSFSLFNTSLQTFLFDWWKMGPVYSKEHALQLPDMGVSYYYNSEINADVIQLSNGKEIDLTTASSGLQSLTPMYVYLKYVIEWVFEHEDVQSFNENSTYDKALLRWMFNRGTPTLQDQYVEDYIRKSTSTTLTMQNVLRLSRSHEIHDVEMEQLLNEMAVFADNIMHAHYANIILEEPELNLFPNTQIEFLYALLKMFKIERDSIVITTHSPYLLYALNNCMMAWMVKDKLQDPEIRDILQFRGEKIDPKKVSVWELRDGRLSGADNGENTIQDSQGLIRGNYFDRIMRNVMSDFQNFITLL